LSAAFHIAQLNIGELVAPSGSPEVAEFEALLDPINAIADAAPGFVWRLQDEEGNATSFRIFDGDTLVNMSVWESIESLRAFAYGMHADGAHTGVMRRRAEWFRPAKDAYLALWWVEAGHIPDLEEAAERLTYLRDRGPTERAFTFRKSFPPPAS
jgi:hypothetical protein